MPLLEMITIEKANNKAKSLLTAVKNKMGVVPNIFGAFANAPAALQGYLSFNEALAGGSLDAALREKIALVTASANGCDYCASAHSFLGEKAGIDKIELAKNLIGRSANEKDEAALLFAKEVIAKRGRVPSESVENMRRVGYSDEEIVEIIAHVSLNTYTNYFNEVFQTENDFPLVRAGSLTQAA